MPYTHCLACIKRMERVNARVPKYTKSFTNLCCHCWCSNAFFTYWCCLRPMKRTIYYNIHVCIIQTRTIEHKNEWLTEWRIGVLSCINSRCDASYNIFVYDIGTRILFGWFRKRTIKHYHHLIIIPKCLHSINDIFSVWHKHL